MAVQELIPNIIHKSERVERYKVLMSELKNQNIDQVNFWEGVHSPNSVIQAVNQAHKNIIRWAKENGLKKVIVFEDDIKFTDKGAWDYYLENEPDDYDIYLGGIYLGKVENNRIVKAFTAMHCYMVHNKFFDVFLGANDKQHIDQALADLGKYVVCNPEIAIQHNGYSDTAMQYMNFDIITQNKKLFTSKILQDE